jgi:hypothetical protein
MQWSAVSPKEVSLMKVPFQTVGVFTDRQFGGNPVAVIPDAHGLSGRSNAGHRQRVQPR